MIRVLISLCLLVVVAACAAPTAPRLFLLEGPTGAAVPASVSTRVIGLREIALPLYARRPQVAAQSADGTLIASDDNRWAEDPSRAATRLLARTIMAATGGDVFEEPWSREVDPDTIAAVEVDRFIGSLNGEVVLTGQLSLTSRRGQGRPRLAAFSITQPVAGDSWDALTDAYARALQSLGQFIATELETGAG